MAIDTPKSMEQGPPRRRAAWRVNALFVGAAALVVALDQLSKWLVVSNLAWGQSVPPTGIFRFTYVRNTGGAFGTFQNQNGALAVTAIIGAAALALLYTYRGNDNRLLRLVLGMQLGGAVGNLVDRVRLGYVVDFVQWGFWPVFNVADASITVSILLLIGYMLLHGGDTKPTPQRKDSAPPPAS